jgi:hypothetical protein
MEEDKAALLREIARQRAKLARQKAAAAKTRAELHRTIAVALGRGLRPVVLARLSGLSPARISQIKRNSSGARGGDVVLRASSNDGLTAQL